MSRPARDWGELAAKAASILGSIEKMGDIDQVAFDAACDWLDEYEALDKAHGGFGGGFAGRLKGRFARSSRR